MKKHVLALLMTCMSTAFFFPTVAQYTDTTARSGVTDSLPRNIPAVKNPFPYKSFIVPATFIVYGVISLHADALQDINETVRREVYTVRQPHKTTIDNYLQYAPAAAVYGLNIAGVHGKNNFLDRTMIYGLSSLMMGIAVNVTKNLTGEIRPDGSNNLSFPSGHTATAFASAEFLRQEYKDVSVWYGIAGYAAATATGYLRISNNKHWVGDVVAGAGVGIISTRLAYWIYPVIKRSLSKNKDVHTLVMPVYQEGSLGLGLVHHF
jgi:membrane-associated phospholipid phosphatase